MGFRGFRGEYRVGIGQGRVGRVWGFDGKMGFSWKNGGFFEKWGFCGFLVKKSGKSRKEPGI